MRTTNQFKEIVCARGRDVVQIILELFVDGERVNTVFPKNEDCAEYIKSVFLATGQIEKFE